jgi:antitoxin component of RelBE/YafQ-DinJ toxin-antitoxin module
MNTQVVFNIDSKLKERAMKKARNEGVPFASILKLATKAFVDGDLDVSLARREEFNPKTRRAIQKAIKEIREGKGLSPAFDNAKDAVAYLRTL